jgi:hypothetical protein
MEAGSRRPASSPIRHIETLNDNSKLWLHIIKLDGLSHQFQKRLFNHKVNTCPGTSIKRYWAMNLSDYPQRSGKCIP